MIIAEIGLNHRGSEEEALRVLKKLIETDIDAVTFQIREEGYYDGSKPHKNKLSNEFYKNAVELVHKRNKLIGFAIADDKMIPVLNEYGSDFWKTLSWDISNDKLQDELKKTKKEIFVSTGVSDEKTIVEAGKKMENAKFIHTQLSQDIGDTNLRAIKRLKEVTKRDVAFGLHCSDFRVLYLSLAFEPSDFFIYIKENAEEAFPDSVHAVVLDKVDEVAKGINSLKKALGKEIKEKMENALK